MIFSLLILLMLVIFGYVVYSPLKNNFQSGDLITTVSLSFGFANIASLLGLYIINFILGYPLDKFLIIGFLLFVLIVFLVKSEIKIKRPKIKIKKTVLELFFLFVLIVSLVYTRFLAQPELLIPGADAGYHLSLAKQILRYGITTFDHWNHAGVTNVYPPAFHLLTAIISILSSENLIEVFRIVAPFISSLTILNIFSIVNKITKSYFSSFVAAFLATFSPLTIWHLQSYFGTLYGLYVLTLTLLLLLIFLEKQNKVTCILFALSLTLLFLSHTQSFMFGGIIIGIIYTYYALCNRKYKLFLWLIIPIIILPLLVAPWYLPLKPAFDYLSTKRLSLADIYFGTASDFFMVGLSSISFALLGILHALKKEKNKVIGAIVIIWIIFLILTNAHSTLRASGITEKRLLTYFALASFILAGYGTSKIWNISKKRRYKVFSLILILFVMNYQFGVGMKSTKTVVTYLSPGGLEGIRYLKQISQRCPNSVILSDGAYTGFRSWVLGMCERKVITDGWEPNAVDRLEPIKNAKRIFKSHGYEKKEISNLEIKNIIKEENVGFIILHRNNNNINTLRSMFLTEFENNKVFILSTGYCLS